MNELKDAKLAKGHDSPVIPKTQPVAGLLGGLITLALPLACVFHSSLEDIGATKLKGFPTIRVVRTCAILGLLTSMVTGPRVIGAYSL